jgi:hypothetical protein
VQVLDLLADRALRGLQLFLQLGLNSLLVGYFFREALAFARLVFHPGLPIEKIRAALGVGRRERGRSIATSDSS